MRLDEFQLQRKSNDASFPPVLDDEGGGGGRGPRNGKFWLRGSTLVPIARDDDYAQSVYVEPEKFGLTKDQVLAIVDQRDEHTGQVLRMDWSNSRYAEHHRKHPASHAGGRFLGEMILFERGWSMVESELPNRITLWCRADKLLQCAKDLGNKFGVLEAEVISVSTLEANAKGRDGGTVRGRNFHKEDYGYGGHYSALLKWAETDERKIPPAWLYYAGEVSPQGIVAEQGGVNHGNAYYRDQYFIRYEPSIMGTRPRNRSKMVRFTTAATLDLTDLRHTYDEMKGCPVLYQKEPFTIPTEAIQVWNGRQWVPMRTTVNEKAPPGKKAKRFIRKAKSDFKDRYGDAWKQVLYATAWKMFGEGYDRHNVDLWRRWWANFRTGDLIAVPNGVQHDEYLFDNLDDFLSEYAIEEAMDGATDPWEAVDPLLLTTYAAGWQAVLYDATQKVLCLRSGTNATPANMAKIATKLAAEIEIEEVALDVESGEGTKSYRMRDDELERFLSRGILPAKSVVAESFTGPDPEASNYFWFNPKTDQIIDANRCDEIEDAGGWVHHNSILYFHPEKFGIPKDAPELQTWREEFANRDDDAEVNEEMAQAGEMYALGYQYGWARCTVDQGWGRSDVNISCDTHANAALALKKITTQVLPSRVVIDTDEGSFRMESPEDIEFYIRHRKPPRVLTEGLAERVRLTPNLLKNVRKFARFICWDIAEDTVPKDDAALTQKLQSLLARIEHSAGHGDKLIVERAELRPLDHVEGFSSTGAHWTWEDGNARVCHHDNAYDEHGRDNVVEITIVAEVAIQSVDWAYTFATNLIHPGEAEITVRNNAKVLVTSIWHDHKEHLVNQRATVYGSYDSH